MAGFDFAKVKPAALWARLLGVLFRSDRRRAISLNIGWMFFDRVFRMGLSVLIVIWLARFLGPEQFGQYNFAISVIGIIAAICGLGLHNIIVREVVRTPDKAITILSTSFVTMMLAAMACVLVIVSLPASFITAYDVSGGFVAVLSLMLLFKSTDFVRSWFESQMQSRVTVLAEFGVFIVASSARIYMLLNGASLKAFVILLVVEAAVLSLVFLVVFYRYSGMRLTRRFSWPLTRQLIRDGFPLMLAGLSIALYMRIDQVMLGVMVNEQAVGIYAAAVRISELWYFVPMAIAASTLPALVDRRQNNPAAFRQLMKMLYRLMWALSLSAVAFIYLFGDLLVTLMFGAAYNQSAAILVIHIWAGIFVALGVMRGNWMVTENLQNYSAMFTIFGCGLNIIGNLYLIPVYETVGAAWATVISNAAVLFIAPLVFKRTRKVVYDLIWPF